MKAILAVMLVFAVGLVHAGEIKIVNGEVMLVPSDLIATGVKVAPEAEKYPEAVREVFRDRGKEVAVQKKEEGRITGVSRYETQTVQTTGVLYDSVNNKIGVTTELKVLKAPEEFQFWFPVGWLVGILAMALSSSLRGREKECFVASLMPAIAVIFAFITIMIALPYPSNVFKFVVASTVFIAVIAAIFATASSPFRNKMCILATRTYFIAMIVLAVAVYYPLIL